MFLNFLFGSRCEAVKILLLDFDMQLLAKTSRNLYQKIQTRIVVAAFQTGNIGFFCTNSFCKDFLGHVLGFAHFLELLDHFIAGGKLLFVNILHELPQFRLSGGFLFFIKTV